MGHGSGDNCLSTLIPRPCIHCRRNRGQTKRLPCFFGPNRRHPLTFNVPLISSERHRGAPQKPVNIPSVPGFPVPGFPAPVSPTVCSNPISATTAPSCCVCRLLHFRRRLILLWPELQKERSFPYPSRKKNPFTSKRESTRSPVSGVSRSRGKDPSQMPTLQTGR
jgi:hypothetical protein